MKRNIKIIFITLLEMVKNIGGVFIMLNVMLCYTFFLLNYNLHLYSHTKSEVQNIMGTILLFILLSYSSILN